MLLVSCGLMGVPPGYSPAPEKEPGNHPKFALLLFFLLCVFGGNEGILAFRGLNCGQNASHFQALGLKSASQQGRGTVQLTAC